MTGSVRGGAAGRSDIFGLVLFLSITGSAGAVAAGTNYWSSGGPEGREATAIAVDLALADTLYAGTDEGVFKSVDAGASWTPTNLNEPFLTIDALVAAGPPTVLFAAGSFGVQRSEDGGEKWVVANHGFGSTYVQALVVDPGDGRILYAGTYRPSGTLPSGVFKTVDGGMKWNTTGLSNSHEVSAIVVDPRDTDVVYAVDRQMLVRSANGGATWSPVERFRFGTAGALTAAGNATRSVVYVVIDGTVYRSADAGRTWTGGNAGLLGSVMRLAADPVVTSTVYAGTENGIFKSTNDGERWARLEAGLAGEGVADLVVDPRNPRVLHAATSAGVYSLTQDAIFSCAGDCSGDDRITIEELVSGVRIAIGAAPLSSCPAFDIRGDGQISIDELVAAVDGALDSCLPVSRVEDFSDFAHFELTRHGGFGFCPPLGVFSATISRQAADRYELELEVLEEGVAGVDECLPGVVGEVECAVVRPRPARILDAEEVDRLRAAFSSLLVYEEPDRICRHVIFDPCLIDMLAWDDSRVSDFICSSERLDAQSAYDVLSLLEDLSAAPALAGRASCGG